MNVISSLKEDLKSINAELSVKIGFKDSVNAILKQIRVVFVFLMPSAAFLVYLYTTNTRGEIIKNGNSSSYAADPSYFNANSIFITSIISIVLLVSLISFLIALALKILRKMDELPLLFNGLPNHYRYEAQMYKYGASKSIYDDPDKIEKIVKELNITISANSAISAQSVNYIKMLMNDLNAALKSDKYEIEVMMEKINNTESLLVDVMQENVKLSAVNKDIYIKLSEMYGILISSNTIHNTNTGETPPASTFPIISEHMSETSPHEEFTGHA